MNTINNIAVKELISSSNFLDNDLLISTDGSLYFFLRYEGKKSIAIVRDYYNNEEIEMSPIELSHFYQCAVVKKESEYILISGENHYVGGNISEVHTFDTVQEAISKMYSLTK